MMSLISDSEPTDDAQDSPVALPLGDGDQKSSIPKPASPIELEQFSIDVQSLMRGLVHELRNPLAAILTASTLLEGDVPTGNSALVDDESAMLLDVVVKESRRMNSILTEFSYFVKPPVSHPQEFDAAKTLRALATQLQQQNILGKVEIIDNLPASLRVFADENQIERAFHQVLKNAAEELKGKGTLFIEGNQDQHQTAICVADSGSGLNAEELDKAFQPFFSHKPAATGLGLSLARGAIRASGGEITLKNRTDGVGARILIMLPTAAPEIETEL